MVGTATLTAVAAVAVAAHGVLADDVTATVDVSPGAGSAGDFAHYWKRCVGSGHMLLGTRVDWQRHLRMARDELGFTGIRGHGLFDDDMSAAPTKAGEYQFYNHDQVFDYLVELGMKPVVELSFMPSAFVSCDKGKGDGSNPCNYAFGDHGGYKGLTMPPNDFEDWYSLVRAMASHLVDRYGLDEIKTWNFEVWNEMWGVGFPEPYMSLYNASARAVKDVDPVLRIGGPATMQTQFIAGFINATKYASPPIPVDFVSTHFYPTDPQCQTSATKSDPDCFAHTVLAAQALAQQAGLPFYITEYNDGLGGSSRDDASAAAFVFRHVGLMEKLDMFSWWTFSDVFEENWMLADPFHNGYGLLTINDVRKPAWQAFKFLMNAGDERLPVTGFVSPVDVNATVSVLATRNSSAPGLGVNLYIANYHRLGNVNRYKCDKVKGQCVLDSSGSFTDPALCNANCGTAECVGRCPGTEVPPMVGDCPPATVTIKLKHAAGQELPAEVTLQRLDSTHGNPLKEWTEQGSPTYPTPAQTQAMQAAAEKMDDGTIAVVKVSDTEASITFPMEGYSTVYIAL